MNRNVDLYAKELEQINEKSTKSKEPVVENDASPQPAETSE